MFALERTLLYINNAVISFPEQTVINLIQVQILDQSNCVLESVRTHKICNPSSSKFEISSG